MVTSYPKILITLYLCSQNLYVLCFQTYRLRQFLSSVMIWVLLAAERPRHERYSSYDLNFIFDQKLCCNDYENSTKTLFFSFDWKFETYIPQSWVTSDSVRLRTQIRNAFIFSAKHTFFNKLWKTRTYFEFYIVLFSVIFLTPDGVKMCV